MMMRFLASTTAAFLWLLIIVSLLLTVWLKHPAVDTSMMSLLPASQQQPLVRQASEQMGKRFSQRLFILVSGDEKQTLQSATKTIAERYLALPEIDTVIWQVDGGQIQASQTALFSYRYVLLTDAIRKSLESGDTASIRQQALAHIVSPMKMSGQDLASDPFALSTSWSLVQDPVININVEEGYLRLTGVSDIAYLVVLQLSGDAFSIKTQQAILTVLDELKSSLGTEQVEIMSSGLLVHADAGAKQAEQEISTIGLGSLAGIILVMLWVFKSLRLVSLLLLPIMVGCSVATAAAFLLFERVHIVTFAFGAGLIGVAIDYALHFLCERKRNVEVLTHIMTGLILGLLSSVLAYAAQAMTPFPGLRQMAVFSVVGLISAWLTVVIWLPRLTQNLPVSRFTAADTLMKWQTGLPSLASQPWLKSVLTIAVVLAMLGIWSGEAEDDIRLLQTSPPELLEQEALVQTKLGLNSSTQFLLVPCDKLQQCLQQEEAIKPWLDRLIADDVLLGYRLLSDQLPSVARQNTNAQLVETLYDAELNQLFNTLNLPDSAIEQSRKIMRHDLAQRLRLQQFPENGFSQILSSQLVETSSYGLATVVSLTATEPLQLAIQLRQIKDRYPEVVLVDQVEAISSLMQDYRQQILLWVAVAYCLVFVILFWRYRMGVWRIILPPMLASLFTLAILMQCLPGINLFHMMALILVLGIGLDMGIFLTETKQASHTWLAVTLSVLTSLMAFGLLSLSETPVLQHFGLTVLLGLALVWILATLMRQSYTRI